MLRRGKRTLVPHHSYFPWGITQKWNISFVFASPVVLKIGIHPWTYSHLRWSHSFVLIDPQSSPNIPEKQLLCPIQYICYDTVLAFCLIGIVWGFYPVFCLFVFGGGFPPQYLKLSLFNKTPKSNKCQSSVILTFSQCPMHSQPRSEA